MMLWERGAQVPDAMRVAITANRDLAPRDLAVFEQAMVELCGFCPEEIIVGGARGGDTLALDLAGRHRDLARTRLVVIVPDTVEVQPREAREAIRRWIVPGRDELIERRHPINRRWDNFESFKARNRAMVDRAMRASRPFTLGFWNGDTRSGTFSALAYARKVGCPLWVEAIEGGDGR
jgi:hypothetical protein